MDNFEDYKEVTQEIIKTVGKDAKLLNSLDTYTKSLPKLLESLERTAKESVRLIRNTRKKPLREENTPVRIGGVLMTYTASQGNFTYLKEQSSIPIKAAKNIVSMERFAQKVALLMLVDLRRKKLNYCRKHNKKGFRFKLQDKWKSNAGMITEETPVYGVRVFEEDNKLIFEIFCQLIYF